MSGDGALRPERQISIRVHAAGNADAAVDDVEVVGTVSTRLEEQGFTKSGGNVFHRQAAGGQQIEINILLPGLDHTPGIRTRHVPGVGHVDSLPELYLAMHSPALHLEVTATLPDSRVLTYRTLTPDLETAVIPKAHAWAGRRAAKDVADLHSLLEMRDAHPNTPRGLLASELRGFRRDTAQILHELAEKVVRKNTGFAVPAHLDRKRLAGLVLRHVSRLEPNRTGGGHISPRPR